MMQPVIYSRERSLGSVLVRAGSWWAQWGHCGLVTPQGTVIEAMAFRGVVETPLAQARARASKCTVVEVDCPDPDAAVAFARQQLGKPYDWGGVFGVVARQPWARDDRWFCSELVEAALAAGGRRRFRLDVTRVTPSMSFHVL